MRDLHKSYGAVHAVQGVDFEVARGEVFGLLGPNGAGKTTTVEILEGYRERTSGIVSVLGHDPGSRPRALRERVGIVLQSSGIYRHATPRELVAHWAGFYPAPRDIEEVIDLAGLRECEDVLTRKLSGGQSRRLDFALALIGDPELIFLDEPTTGFDPAARRAAWETIRALADLGKTVLLTTHYLDEAQALCDRVAIVKDGRILAVGAPAQLGVGASSRYRVALARRARRARQPRDRRSDGAAAPAHERRARARHRPGGPQRQPAVARGRLPRAHRRGRRGRGGAAVSAALALTWRQYRLERKMFWRNPSAAFFNFVLPLLFLALFGAIFAGSQEDLDVIVPGIAGMSIMTTTFVALAMNLVFLREQGVLKRLRGTPLPSGNYLASLAAHAVTNTAIQLTIVIGAGALLFGVGLPKDWLMLLVFVGAGVGCLASLGVALSHAIPNFDSAPAYVNAIFLPVIVLSGVFYDAENAPTFLRDIAQALPLTHLIDGLSAAIVTGASFADHLDDLAVVLIWAAAGTVLAVRGFSWEARRG